MPTRYRKLPAGSAAIVAITMLGMAGCHDIFAGGGGCTLEVVPTLAVWLEDSTNGMPLTDEDARVFIVDDDFAAELRRHGGGLFRYDFERAGRYTIAATAPGYEPWGREGVLVQKGKCHVRTVELVAQLAPEM